MMANGYLGSVTLLEAVNVTMLLLVLMMDASIQHGVGVSLIKQELPHLYKIVLTRYTWL